MPKISPHTNTLPPTVQLMGCYSNCSIMALLDVDTGAAFIVDAFNEADISFSIRIAERSISPPLQHKTLYRPPLNYSPHSTHNTVSPTAQLLPSLSTQHGVAHRSITPLSQHTTLYRPPLNYSPLPAHNTVSPTAQFPPLPAHNTVSPTAQFLPSLNTQHCVAHR